MIKPPLTPHAPRILLTLIALLLLAACSEPTNNETVAIDETTVTIAPTPTELILPTLLPTFTRPVAQPSPTSNIRPTATPRADVDFSEIVVEIRYTIPALALDRRIEGTVVGQITIVDETTGLAAIRQNQGDILIDLQGSLPSLNLVPVPAGCELCVYLEYNLPFSDSAASGWLQDEIMLASLEDYTARNLGAHFPPDTTVGLRRNASAYAVAHTIALTADGQLWRWRATQAQLNAPVPVGTVDSSLPDELASLARADLTDSYIVDCIGTPIETLYLAPTGLLGPPAAAPTETPASADEATSEPPVSSTPAPSPGRDIRILCPAFSLPTTLVPLYQKLAAAVAPTAAIGAIPAPVLELPLDMWLDYQREDGARLTVQLDGRVVGLDPAGQPYTSTLALTDLISVTTLLQESDDLILGVTNYATATAPNILLLRWSSGLSEAIWAETAPPGVRAILPQLDGWLDELIGLALPEIGLTPTITATTTITP